MRRLLARIHRQELAAEHARLVEQGLRVGAGENRHHVVENGSSGITRSSAHAEVTVQLVCVCPAECRGVLLQPFEERDAPERRLVRSHQPSGQAADLVIGEDDVAHNNRCVQDRRAPTQSVATSSNKLLVRHRVRPSRVRHLIGVATRGSQADLGEIIDVDRLHEVLPSPGTTKTGMCRTTHAMLFARMSRPPKKNVGLTIAYGTSPAANACSTSAFPR